MARLAALLTDFGLDDPYVGVMKGVILSRCPGARVVDLCHGIPPQDVRAGALALMTSAPYFPAGTLFVCVVDPGVGSSRRVLWGRAAGREFLAPDNGLLGWAGLEEAREVRERALFLPRASRTFHGRDVLAPVAAALLKGLDPARLGPRVRGWKRLPFPRARPRRGEVLAVDRFGNAITNLRPADLRRGARLSVGGVEVGPLCSHYAAAASGRPLALEGSSGFIELALREGDFSSRHGVKPGEAVHVRYQRRARRGEA